MTTSNSSAIAQLTMGKKLPLPRLQVLHMRIIERALRTAWEKVPLLQRQTALEVDLNISMEIEIKNILAKRGLFSDLATQISRGSETLNFDGSSKERRPDFSLTLRHDMYSHHFPLTIECKLINSSAPSKKGIDLYCNNGILRYVQGVYGWARKEGIMLAYVQDTSCIANSLMPYLRKKHRNKSDPFNTLKIPVSDTVSSHQRSFQYPCVPDSSPGPVDIHHIWLDAM